MPGSLPAFSTNSSTHSGRARVSNTSKGDWQRFHEWADLVAKAVRGDGRPTQLFKRYAELAPTPAKPVPTSILLDLDDVREHLEGPDGVAVEKIGELCAGVKDEKFELSFDDQAVTADIVFSAEKQQFRLRSDQLHMFRVRREQGGGGRPTSLLSYLNLEQSFRITIADSSLLYAAGSFFRPRWRVANISSEDEIPMRQCFMPLATLAKATSEKGTKSAKDHMEWESDSLFGLIDRLTELGRGGFDSLRWLVCDDEQQEVADFIGMNENARKLVFIHAKSGKVICQRHPCMTSAGRSKRI